MSAKPKPVAPPPKRLMQGTKKSYKQNRYQNYILISSIVIIVTLAIGMIWYVRVDNWSIPEAYFFAGS